MARFRILNCRRVGPTHADFEIHLISGSLASSDSFRCYDTHHPVDFRIERIEDHGERIIFHCAGSLGFDDQFAGAWLDTEQVGRPKGFRYSPMPKPCAA